MRILFLEHGADPNLRYSRKAKCCGNIQFMTVLQYLCLQQEQSPSQQNLSMMKKLIEHGAEIHVKFPFTGCSCSGNELYAETPLVFAVIIQDAEMTEMLL